jgi:hypothetical protein
MKTKLNEKELEKLFKAIDANGNGVIDYSGLTIILDLSF